MVSHSCTVRKKPRNSKKHFHKMRRNIVSLKRMRDQHGPFSGQQIHEILNTSSQLFFGLLSVRNLCNAMATTSGAYVGHFENYLEGYIKSRKLWRLMLCQCMCRTKWRDSLRNKGITGETKPHCGCCHRHDTNTDKICP